MPAHLQLEGDNFFSVTMEVAAVCALMVRRREKKKSRKSTTTSQTPDGEPSVPRPDVPGMTKQGVALKTPDEEETKAKEEALLNAPIEEVRKMDVSNPRKNRTFIRADGTVDKPNEPRENLLNSKILFTISKIFVELLNSN